MVKMSSFALLLLVRMRSLLARPYSVRETQNSEKKILATFFDRTNCLVIVWSSKHMLRMFYVALKYRKSTIFSLLHVTSPKNDSLFKHAPEVRNLILDIFSIQFIMFSMSSVENKKFPMHGALYLKLELEVRGSIVHSQKCGHMDFWNFLLLTVLFFHVFLEY